MLCINAALILTSSVTIGINESNKNYHAATMFSGITMRL